MSLGYGLFFGNVVLLPLWLQQYMGYTATVGRPATAPVGILAILISPIIGRNIQRLELRSVVTFSFLVFAATSYWFSTFPRTRFVLAVRLAALPDGPRDPVLLHSAEPDLPVRTEAARDRFRFGTFEFLPHDRRKHLDRGNRDDVAAPRRLSSRDARRAHHDANPATQQFVDGITAAWCARQRAVGGHRGIVNREALTLAVNDVFLLYAGLFILMIPVVWLAKPPFGNVGSGRRDIDRSRPIARSSSGVDRDRAHARRAISPGCRETMSHRNAGSFDEPVDETRDDQNRDDARRHVHGEVLRAPTSRRLPQQPPVQSRERRSNGIDRSNS